MQIDAKKIRNERERRAWSQEHLAEVAGLSLRTVQRVETSGAASFETAKALAAVFEIQVAALAVSAAEVAPPETRRPLWLGVATSIVAGVCGLFIAQQVRADQVMLDVKLALDEQTLASSQVITADGKDAELRLEGRMRVIVSPIIEKDGSVLLSLRVDEFAKPGWVRVAEPKLLAYDDDEAKVSVTSASGKVFKIGIRPHKI